MVSVFAIMAGDDMNVADLQSTNAKDVKKIAIAFISQALTNHAYCLAG